MPAGAHVASRAVKQEAWSRRWRSAEDGCFGHARCWLVLGGVALHIDL